MFQGSLKNRLNQLTSSIKPITNYFCPDQKFPCPHCLMSSLHANVSVLLNKLLHTKSCSCRYNIYRSSTAAAGTIDKVSENINDLILTQFSTGKMNHGTTPHRRRNSFLIEKKSCKTAKQLPFRFT